MFSEIIEGFIKAFTTIIGFSILILSIIIPIALMSVNNNPAYLSLWIILIPISSSIVLLILHYINEWI